jgi:hypothetical protein
MQMNCEVEPTLVNPTSPKVCYLLEQRAAPETSQSECNLRVKSSASWQVNREMKPPKVYTRADLKSTLSVQARGEMKPTKCIFALT